MYINVNLITITLNAKNVHWKHFGEIMLSQYKEILKVGGLQVA